MLPVEVISLLSIIVINTAIVWVLATQSWHIVVNRYFILAVLFVIFWALGALLLAVGATPFFVDLGRVLFLVAPMYTILFLSLFAAVFPETKGKVFTPITTFLAVITVILSAYIIYSPSQFIPIIAIGENGNSLSVDFFWYSLYTLYFNTAFLIAFSEFYMHIRKAKGYQKQQLLYVFLGTFLSALFSLATNLVLPIMGVANLIWLGPTWSLFYIVTVSVAIVRHQLFDIKLAAVRSFAYICALLTLSLIYYIFAYILSMLVIGAQATDAISVSPVNILMALLLAFLFQPIKHFFDKVTNSVFYKNSYKSEDFFAALSNLLTSTVDLQGLLERASKEIATTLNAEQASFYIYYTNGRNHHTSAGTQGHSRLPVHDAAMLDDMVEFDSKNIYVTDLLPDDHQAKRMLRSHKVALVMPLRHAEAITGYVLLGDRLSGNYTKRDLSVLLTVSSELVIAIQNALSLHEIKELNATLQQRIDVATKELRSTNAQLKHLDEVKDEFMSMASHQLRTPLTSVKGYLSMVLDGDVGEVTPQQRKLLGEAFNSSERMVRLIADFLNVSRLQTGRFTIEKQPADLQKLVHQEVDNLKLIAKSHSITLKSDILHGPLMVRIDEAKVQQVIMNLVDNAIYYSPAHSTVTISLQKTADNSLEFRVIDQGIGVAAPEQAKLFTRFFRAKNARKQRPDGTGVGLYLAKKVVAAHGGTMIFHSEEGKGSTFGFRLPLSKLDKDTNDTDDQNNH